MQANKASIYKPIRQAKRDFERKIARNVKHDSFYTYTKSKSKMKPSLGRNYLMDSFHRYLMAVGRLSVMIRR